jgi:transcriptional regulator with XRE-family HTH domain
VARILFQYQKTLAERVKSLRHFKKLSQEKMALEAGIDRTYASQIERGIGNPSLKVLCSLAEVLDVSVKELLYKPEK